MTRAVAYRTIVIAITVSVVGFTLAACGANQQRSEEEVTRVSPTNMPEAVRQATSDAASGKVAQMDASTPLAAAVTTAVPAATADGETPGAGDVAFDPELVVKGEAFFGQFACASCHSVSGQTMSGPPLNGVYGHDVVLKGGETVLADAEYLRRSILDPDAQIVDGYPSGLMSAVVGGYRTQLEEGDTVDALVAYLASLK